MAAPFVYAAINAVSAELSRTGIAKIHVNHADDYKYRSIDDLLDRLAPLLARHRLCVLSRERPELYDELGACFVARGEALRQRNVRGSHPRRRAAAKKGPSKTGAAEREREDA